MAKLLLISCITVAQYEYCHMPVGHNLLWSIGINIYLFFNFSCVEHLMKCWRVNHQPQEKKKKHRPSNAEAILICKNVSNLICYCSDTQLAVKPILNWANVCSRTYLGVFGKPSWFLIGQTFALRTKLGVFIELWRSYIRGPKSFAHVLGTFALFVKHCLWLAESRALLWMRKK